MIKKFVIIGIFLFLLIPFYSAIGLDQRISIKKNQLIYPGFNSDIISIINDVNHSILFGYLENVTSFGIRFTGTENCRKAAEYINEEFQRLGLDSYIDTWRYRKYRCQNVIATYNGTDPSSDAIFVLTAHLDTTENSIGANDDGSGVATILTIANIISKYSFKHTIKLAIVSGEEKGFFGSFDYVEKTYKKNENIITNINLDSIGNSTCGQLLDVQTSERSHRLYSYVDQITQKYKGFIDMNVQIGAHYPDDGQSFLDFGYDSLTLIQSKIMDYPFHTKKDTLDKINYPYYENVTKLIAVLTTEFANKEIDLQVRFEKPMEGYIYFLNIPIIKIPGFNLFRTRIRGLTYLIGRSTAKINITTNEEISMVTYEIDGNSCPLTIFTKPPYDMKIQKPLIHHFRMKGKHKLGVHVSTISGKTAYDEMDIYALTPI